MKSQEMINILKSLKIDKTREELYQSKAVVLSVFRSLLPLTRQILLRLIKSGSKSLKKQYIIQTWFQDPSFFELVEKELLEFKLIRINGEQFEINEVFLKKMQNILVNGYSSSFSEKEVINNKEEEKTMKENVKKNWRKIHETIVGGRNCLREESNLFKVLIKSELCRKNSLQSTITEKGFHFILKCTSDQINSFLYDYSAIVLKENQYQIIFELNLCYPEQAYSLTHKDGTFLSDYEKMVINDFKEIGLIFQPKNRPDIFYITPLFCNCIYEKEQKDIEFAADIIVETNFKLYAYSVSDFILKLLEHFCEIQYILPNLIIGNLTRESVLKAFKNSITADQLIEFLNKNINPQKIKQMTENTHKKIVNRILDDEKRKPLEYLRLYRKETRKEEFSIPDNVIQQLKLWENEKNLEYSEKERDAIRRIEF